MLSDVAGYEKGRTCDRIFSGRDESKYLIFLYDDRFIRMFFFKHIEDRRLNEKEESSSHGPKED